MRMLGGVLGFLLGATAIIAGFYGYINNIILLAGSGGAFTWMAAIRVVGIFVPPLGIIMGFIR